MSSRFLSKETAAMTPYVPGEQPQDRRYIKLNTNENPYPPSPKVMEAVKNFDSGDLRLYPDPDATEFTKALAAFYGLDKSQVLACGGSDEALAFAFMAFFDRGESVAFGDITYGFYKVYADLFGLQSQIIPLGEDFTIKPDDYADVKANIFIANPNAPTGIAMSTAQIEEILQQDTDRLVVVDEAYIDFADSQSCISLTETYDNLLVIQTFSKSRALAGMRLGAAFGNAALIDGMNRIKYSFNPYNLDKISLAVGIEGINDRAYFQEITAKIKATRQRVSAELKKYGYEVLPSESNFLFVAHPKLSAEEMYTRLRNGGILVRYFNKPRIDRFIRVTMGTDDEMDEFLKQVGEWI